MKIGFIGLGQMGAGMAANLVKSGHEVTVYNRTAEKAAPLVDMGAHRAGSPGEAASDSDAVFTMLSDDAAVRAVVHGDEGILGHLRAGALHISSSTISMALSEKLAAAHRAEGQRFVSAPVFGRPDAAAAGKLFVVAGGAAADIETAQPLFDAVGQRTFVVADTPENANLVKLSGNFLIANVIESLGEAMALVGKAGVDRAQYIDMLTSTLFAAPVYKTYGALIAERKFEPAAFSAPLGKKDVGLALEAADTLGVPLPVASVLHDRLLRIVATGGEGLDWSALGDLSMRDSGQTTD